MVYWSAQRNATNPCPAKSHGLAKLKGHTCDFQGFVVPAVHMCVWPSEQDGYISSGIIRKGTWSLWNDELMRRRIVCDLAQKLMTSPSSWIADVGMNIGTVTLPLIASGFNVISFEAFEANAAMVQASLRHLHTNHTSSSRAGKSIIVNKAVTSPGGPSSLCLELATGNQGGIRVSSTCSISVPTTTIDNELREAGVDPFAMKMDIEGHEHHALAGADGLFSTKPPRLVFLEAKKNLKEVDAFMRGKHRFGCVRVMAQQHDYRCMPKSEIRGRV